MLSANKLFLVKPNPDSLGEDINLQPTFFGGITNGYALAGLFLLIGGPLFHHHPGTPCLAHGRRPSFGRVSVRDVWSLSFEIKRLVPVDIGNKVLAFFIKGFEKERLLAVPAVNTDPRRIIRLLTSSASKLAPLFQR